VHCMLVLDRLFRWVLGDKLSKCARPFSGFKLESRGNKDKVTVMSNFVLIILRLFLWLHAFLVMALGDQSGVL
jgi:hypothetical protein